MEKIENVKANNREVGNNYEDLACEYLKSKGLNIIERNYRYKKFGEIDIVAKDKDELVFVEVKYRSSEDFGGADYAVSSKKQGKIRKIASLYMITHNINENSFVRFDTIHITNNRINYIKNAFGGL